MLEAFKLAGAIVAFASSCFGARQAQLGSAGAGRDHDLDRRHRTHRGRRTQAGPASITPRRSTNLFIEFETYSEAGRTALNVRHIVQIEKSKDGNDTTLILANGGSVLVKASYQDVCDSVERVVEDYMGGGAG